MGSWDWPAKHAKPREKPRGRTPCLVTGTRDGGLNADRTQAAEAQVRQWREMGRLPFPNFAAEQAGQMRGSIIYPPPGSPDQPLPAGGARDAGGVRGGKPTTVPQTDQRKEPSP